ncbi:universal stress protein [Thalassobacillus sp. C254]|uniref:universal stress protein n=1 Tax=Thalassobacillus sp. C254 TaxID=1225341 RepID=UPI0006CFFC2C|nr:universal stress protein [Thalassobacillus sp. C254]
MNSIYSSILVAVDGTKEAMLALQRALEMAKENDSKLIISHVIDYSAFPKKQQEDPAFMKLAERHGNVLLGICEREARSAGLKDVETTLNFGSPVVKISKERSLEFGSDLVIVGKESNEKYVRVSESIARHCSCDVLIVQED